MKISLVSKYPIIMEGLLSILNNKYSNIESYYSLDKALDTLDTSKNNIIIYTLFDINFKNLELIASLKEENPNIKVLLIDFNDNKETFLRASKLHIEGYILGDFAKEDLDYAIHKLSTGNRFYDRELLYRMVDKDLTTPIVKQLNDTTLTKRETEILCNISTGLSNYEIAHRLNISENTVKKHISNIFLKINVKDRTQATIHAYKVGLVTKPAN